jgi:peroxiredoxin
MLLAGQPAPDFELKDTTGKIFHLSDYLGKKIVILAFLRGFM